MGNDSSIINSTVNCNYNPFGGLRAEEISEVLVPRIDFEEIIEKIDSNEKTIIEFLGKKGRGKTTHLVRLSQVYDSSQLFTLTGLDDEFKEILDCRADLLLIDSIHHLNFRKRLELFKSKKNLVFTTHSTRWLEFKMAGITGKTLRFKGINKQDLKSILTKRIQLASHKNANKGNVQIDEELLNFLITKHKDDYRAILRHLYEKFEQ